MVRLAGVVVVNPCLAFKVEHLDEKVRNYSDEKGQAQMLANTASVKAALFKRFAYSRAITDSLMSLDAMRPSIASIGTPLHRLGRWHALTRMMGATPWANSLVSEPIAFQKITFDTCELEKSADTIGKKISDVLDAGDFLELEVSGKNDGQYLSCFAQSPSLKQIRERLFRYDRQSVLFVDCVTEQERKAHADILLAVRQVLTLGTGFLENSPGSSGFLLDRGAQSPTNVSKIAVENEAHSAPLARGIRVLVIDPTPIGHASATGQIKRQLFLDLLPQNILQVCEAKESETGLAIYRYADNALVPVHEDALSAVIASCERFLPNVVYCRPTNSLPILEIANSVVSKLRLPLVTHIMDDWPERTKRNEPWLYDRLNSLLTQLLDSTVQRLSISREMSEAFRLRYGGHWRDVANGVDADLHPYKDWESRAPVSAKLPFLVRYLGGFASDMGADSIVDFARVVDGLQGILPIKFEIFTMPWYLKAATKALGSMAGVTVHQSVESSLYHSTLADADALLVAYNFDDNSLAYCGLSLGNKAPECLAAGVPVIAYGPEEAATIAFLASSGGAEVISAKSDEGLRQAIYRLVNDLSYATRLGNAGRAWVAKHRSACYMRRLFVDALTQAKSQGYAAPRKAMPRSRSEEASIQVFAENLGTQRIDISLHSGAIGKPVHVFFHLRSVANVSSTLVSERLVFLEKESMAILVNDGPHAWALFVVDGPAVQSVLEFELRYPESEVVVEEVSISAAQISCDDSKLSLSFANQLWREAGPDKAIAAFCVLFNKAPNPILGRNIMTCCRLAASKGSSEITVLIP